MQIQDFVLSIEHWLVHGMAQIQFLGPGVHNLIVRLVVEVILTPIIGRGGDIGELAAHQADLLGEVAFNIDHSVITLVMIIRLREVGDI
jgi:hypothetical protein